MFFFRSHRSFRKAAMEFGIWEGGSLLFSVWNQSTQGVYLLLEEGRNQSISSSSSSSTNIPWEVTLVETLQI